MKTFKEVDRDVDVIILFTFENIDSTKEIANMLTACVLKHGVDKILTSLEERNQNKVIKDLVDILDSEKDLLAKFKDGL